MGICAVTHHWRHATNTLARGFPWVVNGWSAASAILGFSLRFGAGRDVEASNRSTGWMGGGAMGGEREWLECEAAE